MRRISPAGLDLIKRFEGLRLEAYPDLGGVWTIGYGHTRGVWPGMRITAEEAEAALEDDLAAAESAVQRCTGACGATDSQFAAMVSLCFNIGSANFHGSSVLERHLAGQAAAAADAFLQWDKGRIDGVLRPEPGLLARREAERTLYLAA